MINKKFQELKTDSFEDKLLEKAKLKSGNLELDIDYSKEALVIL